MPRVIFKCPYVKGSAGNAASQLVNYVRYIATREGAEGIAPDREQLPATNGQIKMVERILRDFPHSRDMFEYQDYCASKTHGNASEFITRALEDNIDRIARLENYVDYIALRPRAQRIGSHALFSDGNDPLALSQIMDTVGAHPGNVWLPIISLRREDSARLGYDNAEQWKTFLTSYAPEIAAAMKIPWEQFRWYASFHNESHHPHIHMVCYSADPHKGFLTKNGIAQIKTGLASNLFRQEFNEVYAEQTVRRDTLIQNAHSVMRGLVDDMEHGYLSDPEIEKLMLHLAERLKYTSGKKQYGYLKAPLKSIVDEIVDRLAKEPCVAQAYSLWYEMREEVLRTYRDDMPERVPLSQQKEFKRIKNLIIEEAVRLGELVNLFQNEDMQDDLEPTTETDDHRVWKQAAQYRSCKEILYTEGSTPEDIHAAIQQLEQLWQKGFSVSAHLLGKVYRDGIGVRKDEKSAECWFQRSADAGNDYSEYALGKLLLQQKRTQEAIRWLEKAVEHNNQFAQYRLGKMLMQGEGITKNVDKALQMLTLSAQQGNQYARYTLGKLYLLGKEVPADYKKAREWLTQSAAQGNKYAQFFLDRIELWYRRALFSSATRLLHHLGNIFREKMEPDFRRMRFTVDKKLRRQIREKKIALGQNPDDYEEEPTQLM